MSEVLKQIFFSLQFNNEICFDFKRKVSTPNLEERNFGNVDNGFVAKDACNARSFEAVGMEKLIPSLRRRQHFDQSGNLFKL